MKDSERGILSSYDFKRPSVKIGYSVMVLGIIIMALTMLYPFLNTILNSLKTREEFFAFPQPFLPKEWLWSNYQDAVKLVPIFTFLKNTLIIYIGNTVFSLLFIGMASFGLAHLNVPFKRFVSLYFMSTLLIPSATYLIPSFLNLKDLGLLNSYWAFWLPAGANAFNLLVLRNFFSGLHKELFEAGRIDGASDFICFIRIAVPLSIPILVTLMILGFSATWNDFYWPSLVLSQKELYPIATGIYRYVVYSGSTIQWNVRFAVLSMAMLPPIIFFFTFQKYIIGGLNLSSGIKG